MNERRVIGLHLMSSKGVGVLRSLVAAYGAEPFAWVMAGKDQAIADDGFFEIREISETAGIPFCARGSAVPAAPPPYLFAVSWRWMMPLAAKQQLIVFHDSLLPRYRGFAPLVSALVNGDTQVGVTSILAASEYDRGPIIGQESITINYPIKIRKAIDAILGCYQRLAIDAVQQIHGGQLVALPQEEEKATYSLWRDEHDYHIDWNWDAARIRRFVDAVGYPYAGAATMAGGRMFRILESTDLADVTIENRTPGKVIFVRGVEPVIVCGRGLLQVHAMTDAETGENALPLPHFRTRFGSVAQVGVVDR